MSDFLGGFHHSDTGHPQAERPEQTAQSTTEHAGVAERAARRLTADGHPHGKQSSWILATVIVVAFVIGGIALIMHWWVVFYVCVAVVVASVPAGKLIGVMDDTMVWGATPARDAHGEEGER